MVSGRNLNDLEASGLKAVVPERWGHHKKNGAISKIFLNGPHHSREDPTKGAGLKLPKDDRLTCPAQAKGRGRRLGRRPRSSMIVKG